MSYTASKSQSQNRPGFSISFRHPLRLDKNGRPGLKVRRGINTSDPERADLLVSQMNEILADNSWWNADRRHAATQRFDQLIVDAFYDDIQAGHPDSESVRDRLLPLPTSEEGYARVLFVGTTGAGKTSLLRHFIGSDPDEDRFPSTSTAKTTVSDIEVVPSDGKYRAVVTFFSEFVIQANIEECILNACTAVWEKQSDEKVAERFLNHPEQRFRLSYTLGQWRGQSAAVESEDDWAFDGEKAGEVAPTNTDEGLSGDEASNNQADLERFVRRIREMSQPLIDESILDFGEVASLAAEDASAALDLFQEQVEKLPAFAELAHDVLGRVVERFDLLGQGELHRPKRSSKWPEYWTFETEDRSEFIKQIRWFSSNFASSFGRLLTPLVDGIRIVGPLYPTFTSMQSKMVLIDGQGLGHTADSAASVTTSITRRFASADVILMVDNAQQPIQAAAQAVLRAAAASGHYNKLAIAFTHFDQVKGANLPTMADKRAHVLGSISNYLSNLKEILSGAVVTAMSNALEKQSFMFGGLQAASKKLPKGVVSELERLMQFFEKSVEPPPPAETHPVYDPSGIGFAVQKATITFQSDWSARLNLASGPSSAEHWTRVKALTRRIAGELDVEYDTLRPVADLIGRMSEEISNFLDNPIRWTRPPVSEEEAQDAISAIRREVFTELHDLVMHRLVTMYLGEWRHANDRSGRGSARGRAQDVKSIYEAAAPIPGTVNSPDALVLLRLMRGLVCNAVENSGGMLELAAA